MNIDTSVVGITIPQGVVKNIKRGTEMLWQDGGLPTAFQRCEYIESHGTEQINTGIPRLNEYHDLWNVVARTTSGIDKTILISNYSDYNGTWFGTRNNKWTADESSNSDFDATEFSQIEVLFEKNTITKPRVAISIDGNSWSFQRSSDVTVSTGSIYLFATNLGYPRQYCFFGQVKHISLIRSGTKIVDFIPCYLKTSWNDIPAGTIGLYDLCGSLSSNGTPFYTNAGTGAFTKGADVV